MSKKKEKRILYNGSAVKDRIGRIMAAQTSVRNKENGEKNLLQVEPFFHQQRESSERA